jgi:hypothetical protein
MYLVMVDVHVYDLKDVLVETSRICSTDLLQYFQIRKNQSGRGKNIFFLQSGAFHAFNDSFICICIL